MTAPAQPSLSDSSPDAAVPDTAAHTTAASAAVRSRARKPKPPLGGRPIGDGSRRLVIASVLALLILCVGWELWWAPLRPGGSMLVLKAAPLLIALPGLWRRRLRVYQWWSMLILLYVAEGSLRLLSDRGTGALLGGLELLLALTAFGAILAAVRGTRAAVSSPAPPSGAH